MAAATVSELIELIGKRRTSGAKVFDAVQELAKINRLTVSSGMTYVELAAHLTLGLKIAREKEVTPERCIAIFAGNVMPRLVDEIDADTDTSVEVGTAISDAAAEVEILVDALLKPEERLGFRAMYFSVLAIQFERVGNTSLADRLHRLGVAALSEQQHGLDRRAYLFAAAAGTGLDWRRVQYLQVISKLGADVLTVNIKPLERLDKPSFAFNTEDQVFKLGQIAKKLAARAEHHAADEEGQQLVEQCLAGLLTDTAGKISSAVLDNYYCEVLIEAIDGFVQALDGIGYDSGPWLANAYGRVLESSDMASVQKMVRNLLAHDQFNVAADFMRAVPGLPRQKNGEAVDELDDAAVELDLESFDLLMAIIDGPSEEDQADQVRGRPLPGEPPVTSLMLTAPNYDSTVRELERLARTFEAFKPSASGGLLMKLSKAGGRFDRQKRVDHAAMLVERFQIIISAPDRLLTEAAQPSTSSVPQHLGTLEEIIVELCAVEGFDRAQFCLAEASLGFLSRSDQLRSDQLREDGQAVVEDPAARRHEIPLLDQRRALYDLGNRLVLAWRYLGDQREAAGLSRNEYPHMGQAFLEGYRGVRRNQSLAIEGSQRALRHDQHQRTLGS